MRRFNENGVAMGYSTPKELDVKILEMSTDGYTQKEIAQALGLNNHQTVSNRLRAMGVRSYAQRKDNGYERRPEIQLDMFGHQEEEPKGKRPYQFSSVILAQANNGKEQSTSGLEPYLPDVKVDGLQFNINLVIPALSPLSMNYRYGKKKAPVADHVVLQLVEEFRRAERFERMSREYLDYVAPVVISNLYLSGKHGRQLTYSRDKNKQNSMVLKFIDFLTAAGYIVNTIQPKQINEDNRVSSWCAPTRPMLRLLNLPDGWTVRLVDNYKPVLLRTKKNGRDEEVKPKVAELKEYHRAGEVVIRYNRAIDDAEVRYGGLPISCYLHRIFNEDMQHGGRFYGAMHQTMPKLSRSAITIDGELTVEIDYSAIHPNLLFWMAGREAPEDVYQSIQEITGLERNLVKALLLRLLNANSDDGFKRTVTKSGNPNTKAVAERNPEDKTGILEGFIPGVPDYYKGGDFITSIKEAFPEMADFIGRDKLGVTLQWHDARIMSSVISRCLESGFVCLPVHDSIIVPLSQKDAAVEIMAQEFSIYTNGRDIRIR